MLLDSKDTFSEQESVFAEKLMKTPLMNFGEGQNAPARGAAPLSLPAVVPEIVKAETQKPAEISSTGSQPSLALPPKAKGTKEKGSKEVLALDS